MNEDPTKLHQLEWLSDRTIFLTKHGSHAYGLNTPTSDLDIKGVAVPPREYFFGFTNHFEQAEMRAPVDMVVYDSRKFFKLAADCNPNICEVLWTDPSDHIRITKLGETMLAARELFISKKAKFTFSGYAIAQMKRIDTHWRWLRKPPQAPPTRSELGLPESPPIPKNQLDAAKSMITKKLESWLPDVESASPGVRDVVLDKVTEFQEEVFAACSTDRFLAAGKALGFMDNFLEIIDRERTFHNRMQEWKQYQEWKKTRNPARHALEEKHGYDTKHGMHLVRLMRMCNEILTTGAVKVKRTDDREELLSIRNGAWSYERLREWARAQDELANQQYERSTLRHSPDKKALDDLLCEINEEMIGS